ncbi:hypothetical protein OE88DRAFT_1733873 [Heliocybe sulcata]|uniref:Peptidase C14 caspase domain-containing protein n=1 Tax=Heliocybe sulcata TaxID=5364 RepID=A0A5C3N761_9AGAM|nr:hypothetical protein OE88DRAFT_1733873 [Heliocybe sulcata]
MKDSANEGATLPVIVEQPALIPTGCPRFFALIIGINFYAYTNVINTNLAGAVPDAKAIRNYIMTVLGVPDSQIEFLSDMQATRAAIVQGIDGFRTNPRIKQGDSIFIYYAGHGALSPAPDDWIVNDPERKVQFVLPHDVGGKDEHGEEIFGIPDRTIGALLEGIAKEKGDNITVIFDCCFSGSGTRGYNIASAYRDRGVHVGAPPPHLDREIWAPSTRGAFVAEGFQFAGLRSHVLLAACGSHERARESDVAGFFTKALLETLQRVGAGKITYSELMKRIPDISGQSPQCEGVNVDRILFGGVAASQGNVAYRVMKKEGRFVLAAGSAQGITVGAEFALYKDTSTFAPTASLGTLIAEEPRPFETTLGLRPGAIAINNLDKEGVAVQIRAGAVEDLRIHLQLDEKMLPIFDAVLRYMQTAVGGRRFRIVEKEEKADFAITLDGEREVAFDNLDPIVAQYGCSHIPESVPLSPEAVMPVIHAAAHYQWHLNRKMDGDTDVLSGRVTVEFTELERSGFDGRRLVESWAPFGPNLVQGDIIDLMIDHQAHKRYGMKITNHSAVSLYPYLFFFDGSSLSITSYFQPPISTRGGTVDPPLPGNPGESVENDRSITIGYGESGAVAYSYSVPNGKDIDIGFLKLFLSTEHIDLSHVPQMSPFRRLRVAEEAKPQSYSGWGSRLITVIQRRAKRGP